MLNFIFDTLYELWEYLQHKDNVYVAGVKYKDGYILIKMIPENIALSNNWERLTELMPKTKAENRIKHFKLIGFIIPKEK